MNPNPLAAVTADQLASIATPDLAPPHDGPTAAVVAIFRSGDHGTEVLFIERAHKDGDPWTGQIAFPGGRTEPHDVDTYDTALRETREEIGLDLTNSPSLGRLTDLEGGPRGSRQRLRVSPHLCWLHGPRPELTLNYEVADVLWIPLTHLTDPAHHIDYAYPPLGPDLWPGIQLDPTRVLWGLTLRMTNDLLTRLGAV